MKALLRKDALLCLHPTCWLFLGLTAMLLIPSYPFYVVFFYATLGVFFMFLSGRENGDLLFSALLPVSKAQTVRARVLTLVWLEGLYLLAAVPMVLLRVALFGLEGAANAAGTDPGVAFFGLGAVQLGLFNLVFLPTFYKTGQKVGLAFALAAGAELVYILLAEGSMFLVPWCRDVLDTLAPEKQAAQVPVLLAGLALFALLTLLAEQLAEARYRHVDL